MEEEGEDKEVESVSLEPCLCQIEQHNAHGVGGQGHTWESIIIQCTVCCIFSKCKREQKTLCVLVDVVH